MVKLRAAPARRQTRGGARCGEGHRGRTGRPPMTRSARPRAWMTRRSDRLAIRPLLQRSGFPPQELPFNVLSDAEPQTAPLGYSGLQKRLHVHRVEVGLRYCPLALNRSVAIGGQHGIDLRRCLATLARKVTGPTAESLPVASDRAQWRPRGVALARMVNPAQPHTAHRLQTATPIRDPNPGQSTDGAPTPLHPRSTTVEPHCGSGMSGPDLTHPRDRGAGDRR